MTENKRYEYWEESDTAYDTKIKYGQYFRIIDKKECVDLLNELSDENEQLKQRIRELEIGENEIILKQETTINQLIKENNQLKKDVEYWKQVASQYSNEINVFKHKEQYKTECKDIYYSSD